MDQLSLGTLPYILAKHDSNMLCRLVARCCTLLYGALKSSKKFPILLIRIFNQKHKWNVMQ